MLAWRSFWSLLQGMTLKLQMLDLKKKKIPIPDESDGTFCGWSPPDKDQKQQKIVIHCCCSFLSNHNNGFSLLDTFLIEIYAFPVWSHTVITMAISRTVLINLFIVIMTTCTTHNSLLRIPRENVQQEFLQPFSTVLDGIFDLPGCPPVVPITSLIIPSNVEQGHPRDTFGAKDPHCDQVWATLIRTSPWLLFLEEKTDLRCKNSI